MSTDISPFRGYSGEVVRGFIHPRTILTLIPIFITWAVVLYSANLIQSSETVVEVLVALSIFFVSATLVGRFALPASSGDFTSGVFSAYPFGDAVLFAFRYLIVIIIWETPLIIISELLSLSIQPGALFDVGSLVSGEISMLFGVLLTLVIMVGPLLGFIIATATSSVGQIFSGQTWSWLLGERRVDLIPFFSSLLGGMLLFFGVYLIPLVFIISLFIRNESLEGMIIATMLIPLTPLLASPVLIGRMCGAFVIGGQTDGTSQTTSATQGQTSINVQQYKSSGPLKNSQTSTVSNQQVTAPVFSPITEDPTKEEVTWIKDTFSKHPEIEAAILFLRNHPSKGSSLSIGLELNSNTALFDRQRVFKEISGGLPGGPFGNKQVEIVLLTETLSQALRNVGFRIYQKRT